MEPVKNEKEKVGGSWIGCGVGKFVGGLGGALTMICFPIVALSIPAGMLVAGVSVLICNAIGEELGLP